MVEHDESDTLLGKDGIVEQSEVSWDPPIILIVIGALCFAIIAGTAFVLVLLVLIPLISGSP